MEEEFKEIDYKASLDESTQDEDMASWNHCGGAIIVGCWFGVFLLPLLHYSKQKEINK